MHGCHQSKEARRREVRYRKAAIGPPVYALVQHLFEIADHCNLVPTIHIHSRAAGIVFTLSLCLSVCGQIFLHDSLTTMCVVDIKMKAAKIGVVSCSNAVITTEQS